MAPKAAGKEKLIGDDEDVLQAVILADSFNKRFRPLTAGKPRCLLPICNAPLLDWTFESLALAGVQEIFVICRSHAELVKAAVKESRWSRPSSGIKIVCIVTAKETFSPGDAMRDIYTHGIISSDFVLVTGDLVSNIRIDEVVSVHKERRKTNKDAIMTMVVKESGASHRTRSKADSSVFVLDAETSECLHYEPVTGSPATLLAKIPREILAEHPELEIRNDLIDCSIDVCSVDVPSLFQDNFDYGDIRKDFVHGILTSDLLMKNIYCYVAKDGYAARVKDTKSYDSVSKDILSRWTFPLVPDDNHPGGHIYEHIRGNKYISKDNTVILSRTCKVGNNTLIGSSTQIYDNAQILASVIGQNCIIGANTIIRDSYIFDGTSVGPDCVIERSIIGAGVSIREESHIEKGCLVGEGIHIGPRAHLVPFTRLSKRRSPKDDPVLSDGEDDSDIEDLESTPQLLEQEDLGPESNALVWPRSTPVDDDDDEGEGIANYINERLMRIGDDGSDLELSDAGTVTESEDEEDSSSDEEAEPGALAGLENLSSGPLPLGAPARGLASAADALAEAEFNNEVKQSLARAFEEGHSVDNAAVELKTLRMASNVPLIRVREAVVAGIVQQIKIVDGAAPQRKEIALVVGRWGGLINRIGGADAVETVAVLQTYFASSDNLPLFGQVLAALYQDDVVEEDDIREWYASPSSQGLGLKAGDVMDNMKKCWAIGARMIEQFDAQDSTSEEESGDEAAPSKPVQTVEESSDESDSEDEKLVVQQKKVEDSESASDSDEEDEQSPIVSKSAQAAKDSDSEDDSDDEASSSIPAAAATAVAGAVAAVSSAVAAPTALSPSVTPESPSADNSGSEESDSESDIEAVDPPKSTMTSKEASKTEKGIVPPAASSAVVGETDSESGLESDVEVMKPAKMTPDLTTPTATSTSSAATASVAEDDSSSESDSDVEVVPSSNLVEKDKPIGVGATPAPLVSVVGDPSTAAASLPLLATAPIPPVVAVSVTESESGSESGSESDVEVVRSANAVKQNTPVPIVAALALGPVPVASLPTAAPLLPPATTASISTPASAQTYREKITVDTDSESGSESESNSESELEIVKPLTVKLGSTSTRPATPPSKTPLNLSGSVTPQPKPTTTTLEPPKVAVESSIRKETTIPVVLPHSSSTLSAPPATDTGKPSILLGTTVAAATLGAASVAAVLAAEDEDEEESGEDESGEDSEAESMITGSIDGSAFTGSVDGSGTTGSEEGSSEEEGNSVDGDESE